MTLNRVEIEERPDSGPLTQEEVSDPEEDAKLQGGKAESEPEKDGEEDFRVKVGPDEFPVIFEDGDYENLDKAGLILTLNNLFEYVNDFEIIQKGWYGKYSVNGREVESNLYLHRLSSGYRPKILSKISYTDIVEVDGVNHLGLSREFIEAFIEASSKYGEVADELNTFIDRLNRIKLAEIDNLSEAQIDSMLLIDPGLALADKAGLEQKKRYLRGFTVNIHFQSSNVFWIGDGFEIVRDLDGDDTKTVFGGNAIYYKRGDDLPSWLSEENASLVLPPPSNFDPRLHSDPAFKPFVWVPAGKWEFIRVDRQWKIAVVMPGT